MGVLGLTPFLQRSFPNVVKQLPDRLRGLAGKKLVIDGTLITQRLHFAQVPHQYRHIYGWYRLVKELQDSGVSAICVFDGTERSLAKAREVERRRGARRLAGARGSIELDRVRRLNTLLDVVDRYDELDFVERGRVSERFRQILADSDGPADEDLASPSSPLVPDPEPTSDAVLEGVSPLDRPFPAAAWMPRSTSDTTLDTLGALYSGFCNSVRKLASLTPPPVVSEMSPSTDAEKQEARVEYSLSKSQIQLMGEEEKIWEGLVSPDPLSVDSGPLKSTLKTLMSRAELMWQSYERRTNPPTTQTYEESKQLLRSMGVACVDASGTYEAEALASAMVIRGYGDFVASEDTDVILYEAPLLRNITNRSGPLMLLSGTDIRAALELDRSSFIDFALLLGTDFSQRIKNVGPARALKFIRQHQTIERVIETEKKYPPRVPAQAYLAEVERARLVFRTLPPVPDARQLVQEKDSEGLGVLLQRFGLGKLLMSNEWDFEDALRGNYFFDDPSAY